MGRHRRANPLSRACRAAGAFAALLGAALAASGARGAEISEYDLKALYLYHFTQFVTWPDRAPDAPFVIGVVGEDPFGERLERVIGQQGSGEPEVSVRRVRSLRDVADCQILFVSASEQRRLGQVLDAVGDRPILTVGDDSAFAMRGCAIAFYNDRGRIRIVVNERAVERARLALSSKLLRIAQVQ